MIVSLIILTVVAAGGFALTYLIENDEPFLWRVAAGNVIGSAVFGTSAFILSMFFAPGPVIAAAAALLTLLPVIMIVRGANRTKFESDWAKAKGRLQGGNLAKLLRFGYYAAFLVLFFFFFGRAMIETDQGISTGGSQNLGDLPFHLGAIFSFADGANFPPQNPSYAGATFSYPFIADLITALFIKLGAGVRDAMLLQNVSWAFSLLVILERFVKRLAASEMAAKLAPPLLFFSGGLGFIWFFGDYWLQSRGIFDLLNHLPKDYTISDEFRWGNSLVTLFITQRSLLLGMPIAIVVINFLWTIFSRHADTGGQTGRDIAAPRFPYSAFFVGLLAGTLPLIHLHSLAALFVITGFLLFLDHDEWKRWLTFGLGVSVIALPELIWSMSGSATHAGEFIGWHFGWDAGETNIVWFWIKNTGLLIPLVIAGMAIGYPRKVIEAKRKGKRGKTADAGTDPASGPRFSRLAMFYLPFAFLFIASNVAKFAPWQWDNIKILIYWFIGSIPFAVLTLVWMWRRSAALRIAAAACFLILISSGAIDVWRTVSGQIDNRVFDAGAVEIAKRIKTTTPPKAVFLNAPTYNTAIVLSGRLSLMRYPGHLSSHGIDYQQREADVKQIYRGGRPALALLEKYDIEYVLMSPEERATLGPDEAFFTRFPVVAEAGQYRVYKVK